MLVGAERAAADTSDAARAANFSNEPGALGGVRFLKNVMGLWMLEQCRAGWGCPAARRSRRRGCGRAATADQLVDATDARFLAPADMEREVRAAAGLPAAPPQALVARMHPRLARARHRPRGRRARRLPRRPGDRAAVVGGGAQNALLNRLLAEASGLPVARRPREATALGNALVQGIALGVWPDLTAARAELASRQASARR